MCLHINANKAAQSQNVQPNEVNGPQAPGGSLNGRPVEQLPNDSGVQRQNNESRQQLSESLAGDWVVVSMDNGSGKQSYAIPTRKTQKNDEWTVVDRGPGNSLKFSTASVDRLSSSAVNKRWAPGELASFKKDIGHVADAFKREFEEGIQSEFNFGGKPIAIPNGTYLHERMKVAYDTAIERAGLLAAGKESCMAPDGKEIMLSKEGILKDLENDFRNISEKFLLHMLGGEDPEFDPALVRPKAVRIAVYHMLAQMEVNETPESGLRHVNRTLKFAIAELANRKAEDDRLTTEGSDDEFVCESEDEFAADPKLQKMIRWVTDKCNSSDFEPDLNSDERVNARLNVLQRLLDAILTENADGEDGVEDIASSLGYGKVDEAEQERAKAEEKLGLLTSGVILRYVEKSNYFNMADEPDFRLYVMQHAGELPTECKNGDLVFKRGNWNDNPIYFKALTSATMLVKDDEGGSVPESVRIGVGYDVNVPKDVVSRNYTLEDFRSLFSQDEKGQFKTEVWETTGTLKVGKDGTLGRGGDGASLKSLKMSPETGFMLRLKLADALRQAGADEKFVKMAEEKLNVATFGNNEPISCSLVKSLIVAFDKKVAQGEFQLRTVVADREVEEAAETKTAPTEVKSEPVERKSSPETKPLTVVTQSPVKPAVKKTATPATEQAKTVKKANVPVTLKDEITYRANQCKLKFEQAVQETFGSERPVLVPKRSNLHVKMQDHFKWVQNLADRLKADDLLYTGKDGKDHQLTKENILNELETGFNTILDEFNREGHAGKDVLDVAPGDIGPKSRSIAAFYEMTANDNVIKGGEDPKDGKKTEEGANAEKTGIAAERQFARLSATLTFAIHELTDRKKVDDGLASEFNGNDDDFNYESEDEFAADEKNIKMVKWLAGRITSNDFEPDLEPAERRQAQIDAYRDLLKAIMTEKAEGDGGVQEIAYAQGYGDVESAERQREAVGAKLTSLTARGVMDCMWNSQHFELAKDPAFRIYVMKCAGEFPRDCVNGELVFKSGGWDENMSYFKTLEQVTENVEATDLVTNTHLGIGSRSAIPRSVVSTNYFLDDFRALFSQNEDGTFKTPPARTTGTLRLSTKVGGTLDRGGDGASLKSLDLAPETSLLLRMKLVDAFRQAGADDAFLSTVRNRLDIAKSGNNEPVACSLIKQLIIDFDKRVAEGKCNFVPSEIESESESEPVTEKTSGMTVVSEAKTLDERTVKVESKSASEDRTDGKPVVTMSAYSPKVRNGDVVIEPEPKDVSKPEPTVVSKPEPKVVSEPEPTVVSRPEERPVEVNAGNANIAVNAEVGRNADGGGWSFSGTRADAEALNTLFNKLDSNVAVYSTASNAYQCSLRPQPNAWLAPDRLLDFAMNDDAIKEAIFGDQPVDRDIMDSVLQRLVKGFLSEKGAAEQAGIDGNTSVEDVKNRMRAVFTGILRSDDGNLNPLSAVAAKRNVNYVKEHLQEILNAVEADGNVIPAAAKQLINDDFLNNLAETTVRFQTMTDGRLKFLNVALTPDAFKASVARYAKLAKVRVEGAGLRVADWVGVYNVSKNHGPVGTKDIELNTVYTQGNNTCFMMSVVNGMMATKQGIERLKDSLTQDEDGNYVSLKSGNREYAPEAAHTAVNYSLFETMLLDAYRDVEMRANHDPLTGPGGQGFAPLVGSVFGYADGGMVTVPVGTGTAEVQRDVMKAAWEKAAVCLSENGVCVFHSGGENGGHYITVTAAYMKNGNHCFEVRDSMTGTVSELNLEALMQGRNTSEASIYGGRFSVIAMNPSAVGS